MNITTRIINMVEAGENICLTGSAGVGKTYQINKIKEALGSRKRIAMTATTGLAAMHVKGVTMHSFFGLKPNITIKNWKQITRDSAKWEKIVHRITSHHIIGIDEMSMCRSDTLDIINLICKQAMHDGWLMAAMTEMGEHGTYSMYEQKAKECLQKPFGGKQMIFIGDFLQLPPVVKRGDKIDEPWAFQSEAWNEANVKTIHLTKVMRQNDEEFVNALQSIRMGRVTPKVERYFKARNNIEKECNLKVVATNEQVDEINYGRLELIAGEIQTFQAAYTIHHQVAETSSEEDIKKLYIIMSKNTLFRRSLHLKHGAKVIMLKNDINGQYVNGTIGIFEKFTRAFDTYVQKYEHLDDICQRHEIPYEEHGSYILINSDEDYEKLQKCWRYGGEVSDPQALMIRIGENTVFVERGSVEYRSGECVNSSTDEIEPDIIMHQFPVALAYALTMHKCQGMTLDELEIDFDRCRHPNAGYTALSRVKTYEGLYLKNFSRYAIKADVDAIVFYNNLEDYYAEQVPDESFSGVETPS